jgi:hypothetical protein
VDRIRTLGSSLRLFILVDDRFGRSSHRLFDDSGGDFDDVPSNVVVLFNDDRLRSSFPRCGYCRPSFG